MNSLEQYFQGEYKTDASEIHELDEVIANVLPTFVHAFDEGRGSWPYMIKGGDEKDEEKDKKHSAYSTSTNSMILAMIGVADDKADRKHIFPKIASESIFSALEFEVDGWEDVRKGAAGRYLEVVNESRKEDIFLFSETYGINDPLSLLWCLEVLNSYESLSDELRQDLIDKIVEITREKADSFHKGHILDFTTVEFLPGEPINSNPADNRVPKKFYEKVKLKSPELNKHAFISLRLLQLIGRVDESLPNNEKIYFESLNPNKHVATHAFRSFERCLHLNLSYSDIPDSRFDPAELVFSLEGALRTKGNAAISNETIERTFQVLERTQNLTPYWRPVNPIYATSQGQILLPLSVEVANSLLRICALLRNDKQDRECPFSRHSGMFKRYFRWLKAQVKKLTYNGKSCWGWASEHVGSDGEIHLFQTSEIACFLMNYRHMLQGRIAQRSLSASGLKVDYPQREKDDRNRTVSDYWGAVVEPRFEPLRELPNANKFKIYKKIGLDFIAPRDTGKGPVQTPENYSILLYGPPGTGKSTVGENIAMALEWKYITVTPSDFLAGGSGEVEARAKFIFKCLEEQKQSVILFDEIDHFLLDRESEEYKSQTGIFQFMTPGMLPKINDLRKRKRSIFIIATNYEERIDPAIKRKGRIDYQAPLMPPAYLLRGDIHERVKAKLKKKGIEYAKTAKSSAGFTYIDIVGESEESSLTLLQYVSRFIEKSANKRGRLKDREKTPFNEFCLLRMIYSQACKKFGSSEGMVIVEKLYKDTFEDSKAYFMKNLDRADYEKLFDEFDKFTGENGSYEKK